jgi:hypothetical protein
MSITSEKITISAPCSFPTDVGSVQVGTTVVSNIVNAVAQWSAGTGTQFDPITETKCNVYLKNGNHVKFLIKSAYSVTSTPFIELTEVQPALGPWKPQNGPGGSVGYQVYAVENIHHVNLLMLNAKFKKIAICGNDFAFYKGKNGTLVKIIKESLLPPMGRTAVPQAPMYFGIPSHIDLAIVKYAALKKQYAKILGVPSGPVFTEYFATGAVFNFSGVLVPVDVQVAVSNTFPTMQYENVTPYLGVFACSSKTYNYHPAWTVPAGTVPTANDQMIAAGFTLNSSVSVEGLGLILGYYVYEDYWIEVVDARFDFTPVIPPSN